MKKTFIIGILAVILIAGGIFAFNKKQNSINEPVACTMDAKMCPDGSYVGRTGPKCEFALCPKIVEKNTAQINERIFNNGIYITPLKVIEDSRCPTDVTCIWAGRLTVNTKLESADGSGTKELIFTLGNYKTTFAGKEITLLDAKPAPHSKQTIKSTDYNFTFKVGDDGHADLIRVSSPLPNAVVKSPLVVSGSARGNWYFEASFPIHLYDSNGKELVVTPATAQGEWMTTEFVTFKATLNFTKPTTATGTLVLEKDNASGLPEHDDKISIPVRF